MHPHRRWQLYLACRGQSVGARIEDAAISRHPPVYVWHGPCSTGSGCNGQHHSVCPWERTRGLMERRG